MSAGNGGRSERDVLYANVGQLRGQRAIGSGHVLVMGALAARSDPGMTRWVWPSQRTIADDCGLSEKHVYRLIGDLVRLGLLLVRRSEPIRRADGTYTRQTNRYLICTGRIRGYLRRPAVTLRELLERALELRAERKNAGRTYPASARGKPLGLETVPARPAARPGSSPRGGYLWRVGAPDFRRCTACDGTRYVSVEGGAALCEACGGSGEHG